jgi:general stress protein YciG
MTKMAPNQHTGTDREKGSEAGHKGGSGNFAENREKASEAGRKGGQHSSGNFAQDKEKASEAGRKGGSK